MVLIVLIFWLLDLVNLILYEFLVVVVLLLVVLVIVIGVEVEILNFFLIVLIKLFKFEIEVFFNELIIVFLLKVIFCFFILYEFIF